MFLADNCWKHCPIALNMLLIGALFRTAGQYLPWHMWVWNQNVFRMPPRVSPLATVARAVHSDSSSWGNSMYKSIYSNMQDVADEGNTCRYENGTSFWLPGFFFTPSFTTAALQNYARAHNLAIDSVGFDFQIIPRDPSALLAAPIEGVYIHGMYLEGCGWDSSVEELTESRPKVLTEPAPVVWLKPMQTTQFSKFPHFSCPVYRTAERKGVLHSGPPCTVIHCLLTHLDTLCLVSFIVIAQC
jgi:Dynein heavy chain C-terminal domain